MATPGAPSNKGAKVPGGAPRYYNKGTGRMEGLVHGRFPGTRPSAAARNMGAPRARAAAPPPRAKSPYIGGQVLQLPGQSRATRQSMASSINNMLNAESGVARAPFQQKGQEIGNTERTVAGRYGQYS